MFALADELAVLIIVNDPDAPTREDELRASFGLTIAEARVAALVITGMGLPAVARQLGVSRETARSHLARCFDTTGARSQAALARLAATLPRR